MTLLALLKLLGAGVASWIMIIGACKAFYSLVIK